MVWAPVLNAVFVSQHVPAPHSCADLIMTPPALPALSPNLQVLHDKCFAAGIQEFICKPFRVEDVQRVLALVAPRLLHPPGSSPAPAPCAS